jgi:hypothetical protein
VTPIPIGLKNIFKTSEPFFETTKELWNFPLESWFKEGVFEVFKICSEQQ